MPERETWRMRKIIYKYINAFACILNWIWPSYCEGELSCFWRIPSRVHFLWKRCAAPAHTVILKPEHSKKVANIIEESLSHRYPDFHFHEALREEKDKLHTLSCNDHKWTMAPIDQCLVIEHLINFTHQNASKNE